MKSLAIGVFGIVIINLMVFVTPGQNMTCEVCFFDGSTCVNTQNGKISTNSSCDSCLGNQCFLSNGTEHNHRQCITGGKKPNATFYEPDATYEGVQYKFCSVQICNADNCNKDFVDQETHDCLCNTTHSKCSAGHCQVSRCGQEACTIKGNTTIYNECWERDFDMNGKTSECLTVNDMTFEVGGTPCEAYKLCFCKGNYCNNGTVVDSGATSPVPPPNPESAETTSNGYIVPSSGWMIGIASILSLKKG